MGVFLSTEKNGGKEDLPTKESVWLSILNKINEVYTFLKAKVESLFQRFSDSLWKGLEAVANFLACCCEIYKEGLSWIINEVMKLIWNKEGPVPDQKPSQNLAEMIKMLAQKAMEVVRPSLGDEDHSTPYNKLKLFIYLAQGFAELLEYAHVNPWKLAHVFLDAFIIYRSNKSGGGFGKNGLKAKKLSAMFVVSLLSYIRDQEVGWCQGE